MGNVEVKLSHPQPASAGHFSTTVEHVAERAFTALGFVDEKLK
jgi:hypothetical protein